MKNLVFPLLSVTLMCALSLTALSGIGVTKDPVMKTYKVEKENSFADASILVFSVNDWCPDQLYAEVTDSKIIFSNDHRFRKSNVTYFNRYRLPDKRKTLVSCRHIQRGQRPISV